MNKIMHTIMLDHDKKIRCHTNRYIVNVMRHAENTIPKSTTCFWKLSKNYDILCMYQFLVSSQYFFRIDISSDRLGDNNDVGATFMSSMFYHSTTIPLCKNRKNGRIYLKGPKDMYNFAWGSNGTNKEK